MLLEHAFRDSHYPRQVLGLNPASEFEQWLEKIRRHPRPLPPDAWTTKITYQR